MARSAIKDLLPFALQRSLRRHLRTFRRLTFKARVAQRTIYGQSLEIRICDATSAKWYDHDTRIPHDLAPLMGRPYRRIYYLGAHHGVYAIALAKHFGWSQSKPMLAIVKLQKPISR